MAAWLSFLLLFLAAILLFLPFLHPSGPPARLLPLLGAFGLGALAASLLTLVTLMRPRRRGAEARDPREEVEAHLARGARAREAGRLDEAIQHHARALEAEEGHARALFALAEDYEAAGEAAMVREHLRRILARNPAETRALAWLRGLSMAEGRWEEALDLQRRLLRQATDATRAQEKASLVGIRYEAGKAALGEGRCHDAQRLFQETIRDDANFVPGYLGLGDTYQALGRRREAVRAWQQGLERVSALPLLHRLEQYERREGHPGEMIQVAQRALARAPDDVTLTVHLGLVYAELSMLDEAAEQFERLAALAPEIGTFHAHLGSLLERRGKIPEALAEYGEALRSLGAFDLPCRCLECGAAAPRWVDRCERCGRWNTVRSVTRTLPPLPPPPPPHGGR